MSNATHPLPAAYAYAPATDTIELPAILRGAVQPTAELHLLDLAPAVPARTARRTVRALLSRVARSAFVRQDLAGAWALTRATAGVAGATFAASVLCLGPDTVGVLAAATIR